MTIERITCDDRPFWSFVFVLIAWSWIGLVTARSARAANADFKKLGRNGEVSSTQPDASDVAAILKTTEKGQPAAILICLREASGVSSLLICSAAGQPYLALSRGTLVMIDSTDPGTILLFHGVRFRLKLRGTDEGTEFDLELGKVNKDPLSIIDWQPVSLVRSAQTHATTIIEYPECETFSIETKHARTILRGQHEYGEVKELATVDVLSDGDAFQARTVSGMHLSELGVEKLNAAGIEAIELHCRESEYSVAAFQSKPLLPGLSIWSHDGVSRASAGLERLVFSRPWVGLPVRLSVLDELQQINLIARLVSPDAANDISALTKQHMKASEESIQKFVKGEIPFATMRAEIQPQLKTDDLQKLIPARAYIQFCGRYLALANGLNDINPMRPILTLVKSASGEINLSPDQQGSIALLCIGLGQESDVTTAEVMRDHPSEEEIKKISGRLSEGRRKGDIQD